MLDNVYVYKIYLNRYLLCENSMLFWMERRMYDKAAKIPMNCMWLLGVLAELSGFIKRRGFLWFSFFHYTEGGIICNSF